MLFSPLTNATDLMDIYKFSLENDTAFKAAYSTYMANAEAIPIARSALLPQINFNSQVARNAISVKAGGFSTQQTYNNHQFQLSASQTVFNYQAWSQLKQAKDSVKSALAQFDAAAQDLILRTTQAYLDILFAADTLGYAEAKKRANKRQLDQAQQRFNVGVDTITSVYEAKAAYDQSIAEVISAKNNQINQNENLRKLTNRVFEALAPLRDKQVPLIHPEPNRVEDWIATALKQNYNLLASKYALAASRQNIKTQSGAGWPTLSIQSNGNQTTNDSRSSDFFVPAQNTYGNIALSMNFPVYQGGLVESQTRRAQYQFQTTSEQFEQTYRDVLVSSRTTFNTIVDGINKVKADRQTLLSQQRSLESTEAQYEVGTRTMVDVTNAQRRLFEAQEQLARDQYKFIMSVLNLKYIAGTLSVADVEEVNSWLDTKRINLIYSH